VARITSNGAVVRRDADRFPPLVALALLAASLAAVSGCSSRRPHAPALRDGPVYQNSEQGIRFRVPEDWTQAAQAQTPPGRLAQEVMLVEYRLVNADPPAVLRLTVVDLPENADIQKYLAETLPGAEGWHQEGRAESIQAQGKTGSRFTFTQRRGKERTTREVAAFRRGARVYFVTGIFGSTDTNTRQQLRRTVESIEWKG
jgi:hypothetical protein